MHRTMQFFGTVVHRLLLREIHHDGSPDEMRFLLGNVSVRFSKIEFCLITRLKFGIVPDTSKYLEVENGIHQRCFGGRNEIKIEELKERVQQGQWTEQFDVVKLCLLLLLHVFLIGRDERGSVPIWQVRLVDNLDGFDVFPWGCLVYSYFIYGFKTALSGRRGRFEQRLRIKGKDKHPKEKYNIWGFSYALLIFALEVIPALAKEFATCRNVDPFPRILKWEFTRRPRPDKVKKIIKDRMFVEPEITPTNQEVGKWYYEGDRLEIVLDELRDSDRRIEEQHAEMIHIVRTYRHNNDQHHTPLPGSLSMPQHARSDPPCMDYDHPLDSPVIRQQTVEVQDHPLMADQTPKVQDPQPMSEMPQDTVGSTSMNFRPIRLRKRGWQLTTPYTDPYRPKRARSASHKFKPDEPVDAKMLAEYLKFKEDPTGRRDVDLQVIVDVTWVIQFESNNIDLEDTHLESYLKIVRKRQRMFPEVYQQNVNIIDPYLYSYMVNWWDKLMPAGTRDKPFLEWPVLSYKWTDEQLAWARGNNEDGCLPWKEVDTI
ncbi:hypothetical protein Ddye_023625 [Dipteronia dyeriana]|uniref:DUF1985 domain-containing protein n=1 Tax=Dipteronia dyeriana TaxID=168575 RepID=A0AAD9TTS2_9ROSI|nr:hypothetical protein Ddye_023625 [Dipteronia dyeriana]